VIKKVKIFIEYKSFIIFCITSLLASLSVPAGSPARDPALH
jgi:hypothetical protein